MAEKVLSEIRFIETDEGYRVEIKGDKEKLKKMGSMHKGFRPGRFLGRGRSRFWGRGHGCGPPPWAWEWDLRDADAESNEELTEEEASPPEEKAA
jgi:hypothetical protein